MSYSPVEAAREICDVLDALVLMTKLDHAPLRAVSLLQEARSRLRSHLDQIDRAVATANGLAGLPPP
jgi:hypothetical protein